MKAYALRSARYLPCTTCEWCTFSNSHTGDTRMYKRENAGGRYTGSWLGVTRSECDAGTLRNVLESQVRSSHNLTSILAVDLVVLLQHGTPVAHQLIHRVLVATKCVVVLRASRFPIHVLRVDEIAQGRSIMCRESEVLVHDEFGHVGKLFFIAACVIMFNPPTRSTDQDVSPTSVVPSRKYCIHVAFGQWGFEQLHDVF